MLKMNNEQLEKFNKITAELLEHGEDKEEMTFWQNIFPSLSAREQDELLKKMETELETLNNLSK